MELQTKKAGVLELQPVNQQALLDILIEMGGAENLVAGEFDATDPKLITASNRALTYCLGWGVLTTPPDDALETLVALGKPTHLPEITRAAWLRYLALDDTEIQDVVAAVMKLSFGGEEDGG